jgi:hypothetical protein
LTGIKQAVPNFPFRKNLGISALFKLALYLHIKGPYKTFPYIELWQIFITLANKCFITYYYSPTRVSRFGGQYQGVLQEC